MPRIKVWVNKYRNRNGTYTIYLRWVIARNLEKGIPGKWRSQRVCRTEADPTYARMKKWMREGYDAASYKERELNAGIYQNIVDCERTQATREYLAFISDRLAPTTADRIERELARFNRYMDHKGHPLVSRLRVRNVAMYRNYLTETGLRPTTVNCALSDLSGFFRWAIGESYAVDNVAKSCNRVSAPITRAVLPIKTAEEFWAMLDYFHDIRKRMTIALIACSGMRDCEARLVTFGDWDKDTETLQIHPVGWKTQERTKRHKRLIPLSAVATRAITDMLETSKGPYILGLDEGRRPYTSQVNSWMRPLGVNVKHLRRWYRTALETVEAPQYIIDDLLGHRTTRVRAAYTPAYNLDAAWPAIRRFDAWLASGRPAQTTASTDIGRSPSQ